MSNASNPQNVQPPRRSWRPRVRNWNWKKILGYGFVGVIGAMVLIGIGWAGLLGWNHYDGLKKSLATEIAARQEVETNLRNLETGDLDKTKKDLKTALDAVKPALEKAENDKKAAVDAAVKAAKEAADTEKTKAVNEALAAAKTAADKERDEAIRVAILASETKADKALKDAVAAKDEEYRKLDLAKAAADQKLSLANARVQALEKENADYNALRGSFASLKTNLDNEMTAKNGLQAKLTVSETALQNANKLLSAEQTKTADLSDQVTNLTVEKQTAEEKTLQVQAEYNSYADTVTQRLDQLDPIYKALVEVVNSLKAKSIVYESQRKINAEVLAKLVNNYEEQGKKIEEINALVAKAKLGEECLNKQITDLTAQLVWFQQMQVKYENMVRLLHRRASAAEAAASSRPGLLGLIFGR